MAASDGVAFGSLKWVEQERTTIGAMKERYDEMKAKLEVSKAQEAADKETLQAKKVARRGKLAAKRQRAKARKFEASSRRSQPGWNTGFDNQGCRQEGSKDVLPRPEGPYQRVQSWVRHPHGQTRHHWGQSQRVRGQCLPRPQRPARSNEASETQSLVPAQQQQGHRISQGPGKSSRPIPVPRVPGKTPRKEPERHKHCPTGGWNRQGAWPNPRRLGN